MGGMSETAGSDEGVFDAVMTTPQEWRGFLEQYAELYLKNCDDEDELADLLDEDQLDLLEREGRVDVWLGEAPAREEALVAAEERLGVRFPPSLRGFFLASDGWTPLDAWVDGIHPCGRVSWMRDGDAGSSVIEVYDSIADNEDIVQLFRRSLEIARGEDFWLLDPTDVGPDGEWAAFDFAPKYGSVTEYPSFSALLQSEYEDLA
ncbi:MULTISPECIES: SMI1/KNR4 family protein [unclassified Streptomyces]|uniref:SMI1/KNR4 family protein n=1 Tax=unclassified Streptomyces TaxID=2593676 RepID=UPI003248F573